MDLTSDITLSCTNAAGNGVAVVTTATPMVIDGHGYTITQTCTTGNNNGVLESNGTGSVTLRNVTITGGHAARVPTSKGGGISVDRNVSLINSTVRGNTARGGGGGIFGWNVSLTNSTVSGNTAKYLGGGIYAFFNVSLTNSTVSDNVATATNATGGGIDVLGNNTVSLTNSTVSGNTAGTGGGIWAAPLGGVPLPAVSLTNSTVSGNKARISGGGIQTGDLSLVYSTVMGNTAPTKANLAGATLNSFGSVVALPHGAGANCGFAFTPVSKGYNWEDHASCGFTQATDHSNAGTPTLGALASNGGPTQTHLPQAGSGLIDAVPNGACQLDGASGITTDQRALARPFPTGGACDIGAVEVKQPKPDHFKCYAPAAGGPKSIGNQAVMARLRDQFSVGAYQTVTVKQLFAFCNPVQKLFANTLTPIQYPALHLAFYEITGAPTGDHGLVVENQFGIQDLSIGPARWLGVPTSTNAHHLPDPTLLNHFQCYPVRQGTPPNATVTLIDQWHTEKDVAVGPPVMFCNPTAKIHNNKKFPIVDPVTHLTCYQLNQPPFHKSATIRNQFNSTSLTIVGASMLCVPSRKLQVTTTTQTTTTTTKPLTTTTQTTATTQPPPTTTTQPPPTTTTRPSTTTTKSPLSG